MAEFTIALKNVIKVVGEDGLGLNDYPIWDPSHREELNRKIIRRYYNREIGYETIELWTLAIQRKMHEIMPPYIELFKSKITADEALRTVDLHTVSTAAGKSTDNTVSSTASTSDENSSSLQTNTTAGESSANATAKSDSRSVASEPPSQQLAGDDDYATNVADVVSNNTSESTNTETGSASSTGEQETRQLASTNGEQEGKQETEQESDVRVTGYQGSLAALVAAYRSIIVNIDLAIVEDLNDCFMGIWGNGDEYTPNQAWRGYFL